MENIVKNIKDVKSKLPHGAQTEIARMCGKTVYTVNRVFSGKSRNKEVILAIGEYIKEINDVQQGIDQFVK